MKIGLVDIDTSHPRSWTPILREMGHQIVGVCDGGAVHPRSYVEAFVQEHGIDRVFKSLEELAQAVDIAIIHGCNWDTHIDRAEHLLACGKAVLIDKPLAGSAADLMRLIDWSQRGARVTGGSSLRFCDEALALRAQWAAEEDEPRTAFVACGVDEFNYGIHAYALLAAIMGHGAASVQHLHHNGQRQVRVDWDDGRIGFVNIGPSERWLPFAASVVTRRSIAQFTVNTARLYTALLEAVMPYLTGQVDQPSMPMRELIEPELWAIAARCSWQEGDRVVRLDEDPTSWGGYDGAAFAAAYRQQQYPAAAKTA